MSATEAQTRQPGNVADLRTFRERQAWLAAAQYLDARGLPPCVPCSVLTWVRRRVPSAWCNPARPA